MGGVLGVAGQGGEGGRAGRRALLQKLLKPDKRVRHTVRYVF